ncbi:MAG: ABC transporter permease [Burkholderiaceae bacterium]
MTALASALRAVAAGVATWLLIQTLLFVLVQAAPGGPAAALAGDFATLETQAAITRSYALDRPVTVQYASFLKGMAAGDFGISYQYRRPVTELIADRLGPTLALMLSALAISVFVGRALGIWAATRRDGGRWVALMAAAVHALPVFWVGQLLMLSLGFQLAWFPLSGMSDLRHEASGLAGAVDLAWHAVLPVLTLSLQQIGFFVTVAYAKARLESEQGYVRAARARGLTERAVVWGHVSRNVAPQLATATLNHVGMLFTGAVLVETLFAWPGLGRLLTAAILSRDHPVLLGVFALITSAVIVCSVLAALVQTRLDPRIADQRDVA